MQHNNLTDRIQVVLCTKDLGEVESEVQRLRESNDTLDVYVGVGKRGNRESTVPLRRSLRNLAPVKDVPVLIWADAPGTPTEEEVLNPNTTWVYAIFRAPGAVDVRG